MFKAFTLDTKACFLPAFLQTVLRQRLERYFIRKHLLDSTEEVCMDVARHLELPVRELEDFVDLDFIEPYLSNDKQPDNCLCLTKYQARMINNPPSSQVA